VLSLESYKIHVRILEELHKRLRVSAAENDITIQEWLCSSLPCVNCASVLLEHTALSQTSLIHSGFKMVATTVCGQRLYILGRCSL
jgi:hypothetical protein